MSSQEGVGTMAHCVHAAQTCTEKQLPSLPMAQATKRLRLESSRSPVVKLSDDDVAELAMLILM